MPSGPSRSDFEDTKPDVVITANQSSPTNTDPLTFAVAFSEAVTGLAASDFDVSNDQLVQLSGSGSSYVLTVDPMADGDVDVSLPADRANAAAQPQSGNDASNTASVTYDGTAPTVAISQAGGQPDPTTTSPIAFTAQFSEAGDRPRRTAMSSSRAARPGLAERPPVSSPR